MEKIIYFSHPDNPKKVATMVSSVPVEELKERGHIPEDAKYLIDDFDIERPDLEYLITLEKIEYLMFDNLRYPKKLVPDLDVIRSEWLERFRRQREDVMNTLDRLQMRAYGLQKPEVVTEIELDKQALRDLPDVIDLKQFKTIASIEFLLPGELLVDYNDKYKNKLQITLK